MENERVFIGPRTQRRYGLGWYFASLFRRAIPVFKSRGEYPARKAAKTGINTIRDIASGVNPRVEVKRHLADVSDEILDDVKCKIRRKMTDRGLNGKKSAVKRITGKKKNPKRKIKDIFYF